MRAKPRPDWVHCVVSEVGEGHPLHEKTWCGKDATMRQWFFQGVDHAALTGFREAYQVVCPQCYEAIVKALGNGIGRKS